MDTWLGHHLPSQAGLGDGGAEGCLAGVVAGASHYGAGKKVVFTSKWRGSNSREK